MFYSLLFLYVIIFFVGMAVGYLIGEMNNEK